MTLNVAVAVIVVGGCGDGSAGLWEVEAYLHVSRSWVLNSSLNTPFVWWTILWLTHGATVNSTLLPLTATTNTHTLSSLPLSIPQPCADTLTIITLREGFRIIPQKAVNRYNTYISGIEKVWYLFQLNTSSQGRIKDYLKRLWIKIQHLHLRNLKGMVLITKQITTFSSIQWQSDWDYTYRGSIVTIIILREGFRIT